MKYKILILTIVFFVLFGKASAQYCSNDSRYTEVPFFDSTEITIGSNIQYGIAQDFQGNPDTLLLDLYYPNLAVDLGGLFTYFFEAPAPAFSRWNLASF